MKFAEKLFLPLDPTTECDQDHRYYDCNKHGKDYRHDNYTQRDNYLREMAHMFYPR